MLIAPLPSFLHRRLREIMVPKFEGLFDPFLRQETMMPNTFDYETAHSLFETGKIPFLMAGPWALDRIRASRYRTPWPPSSRITALHF